MTTTKHLQELRATLCAVGVVGQIGGHDVVRRESVIDLVDRRLADLASPPKVPLRAPMNHCRPYGMKYDLPPMALSGYQLREALGFLAPDGIADQLEQEVCIALRDEGRDTDGEVCPRGLYCWLSDYPEEGSILLDGHDARIMLSTALLMPVDPPEAALGILIGYDSLDGLNDGDKEVLHSRARRRWAALREACTSSTQPGDAF